MHLTGMDCCGIRELAAIGAGPTDKRLFLKELHTRMYKAHGGGPYDGITGSFGRRFAHILFSEAGTSVTYGRRLKEAIEAYKLGTVVESPQVVNPNSGNLLRAYLWTIDHEAFSKWNPDTATPVVKAPKTRLKAKVKVKEAPRVSA